MNRVEKAAYNNIIVSLRDEPENWNFDGFTAQHKTKPLRVWLANRYYGTDFTYNGITVGDVTLAGFFWPLLPWEWWRVRIVRAAQKAQFDQVNFNA